MLRWELLVICWLSALALELLFELLFMELLFALELLFIIRPHGAVEFLKMRCCFVAEIILVPREQTRSGGRQSKPVISAGSSCYSKT